MNDSLACERCNTLIEQFEKVVAHPVTGKASEYLTGIDLGTAYVVLAVTDKQQNIVAGAFRRAEVVRDGMIVDYIGAIDLIRELKAELEEKLATKLVYAAAAIPPGTENLDGGAIKNVVESAGFELTALLDEPTAANLVLNVENGAIVDIGGGTTGISIIKNGEVIEVADEATGGTHFTLVTAGAYHLSFSEAEAYKQESKHHVELLAILKPVIEKIASIIADHIQGHDVTDIYLVGGTSCLKGIEKVIEKTLGIKTWKPENPLFVTPLGIALSCQTEPLD